ncbi:MAG: hypothetical protein HZA81_02300 [Candidatus Taylorbacteria bacterium]|nr:hypothetical protein [Candidatus Taylorbacteria bacterium]
MRNISKVIAGIAVILALAYAAFALDLVYKDKVDDFATCVAAGNPVMESYPRQCRDKDGNLYVEDVSVDPVETAMIEITSPKEGDLVASPVFVAGRARGPWYFEASFPVQVIGADGKVLGEAPAQAQGEWMTEEFVPFSASVAFDPGANSSGVIRFKKDNPSGLPENDAMVEIPVSFKAPGAAVGCRPTGCSGQICSDQDVASTCEYRSEYACYRSAKCERQSSGKCGWTPSAALSACLANPPQE